MCLGVDVSSEKAVAHIARVLGIVVVGVGGVVGLRAQVLHGVGGGDEAGVGGQVEVEAFPECIDPVVGLWARHIVIQTPPSPLVVQLVGERLSEIIDPERGNDFVGFQLFDETFWRK